MSHDDQRHGDPVTAADVTGTRFALTALGRRGYQPDEVDRFMSRVANELSRRDQRESSLRSDAEGFKYALREWQSRQSDRLNSHIQAPNADAVMLLSQAQQQAEGYVSQAQNYCRQLIDQARSQAAAVLHHAQERAEEEAERAVQAYRRQAGDARTDEAEEQARQLARTRSFLAAVESAEEQLRSARESLAAEVDQLSQQTLPSQAGLR